MSGYTAPSIPIREFALKELAQLVRDEGVRARFHQQCLDYFKLRREQPSKCKTVYGGPTWNERDDTDLSPRRLPLPFLKVDDDENDLSDETVPLMLCEQYAILAAVHDSYCLQESPIMPAPNTESSVDLNANDGIPENYKDGLAWVGLRTQTVRLNEDDLPYLQIQLAAVKLDLETWQVNVEAVQGIGGPVEVDNQQRHDQPIDEPTSNDQIESVINQNDQEATNSKTEGAQTGADFEFIEGGYKLWGVEVNLSGHPLAALKMLAESRTGRVTAKNLLDHIWGEGYGTDRNAIDAIRDARKSLRKTLQQINAEGYGDSTGKLPDPIRNVDKGSNLAWELKLPFHPNSTQIPL